MGSTASFNRECLAPEQIATPPPRECGSATRDDNDTFFRKSSNQDEDGGTLKGFRPRDFEPGIFDNPLRWVLIRQRRIVTQCLLIYETVRPYPSLRSGQDLTQQGEIKHPTRSFRPLFFFPQRPQRLEPGHEVVGGRLGPAQVGVGIVRQRPTIFRFQVVVVSREGTEQIEHREIV